MNAIGRFVLSFACLLLARILNAEKSSYRAATVQFDPYFEKGVAPVDVMSENARKYADYAARAKLQGASIVVFPEYGLLTLENYDGFLNFTRDGILPALQQIPDPKKVSWNPCQDPQKYDDSGVLEILSCASRNNSVALLANLLTKQTCDNRTDPECPKDGRYQRNTNVIFDKNGTLIATYHKKHLYGEFLLDAPAEAEYVIFEVDSVKFASFICFDIAYDDPAIRLVTEKGIKNLIFSTAWINEMPFLLPTQLYSQWARGTGANLIVSNYYKPEYRRLGTGIYSSQLGAANETFDISDKGALIMADLPVNPSPVPVDSTPCTEPFVSDEPSVNSVPNNSYVPFVITDKPSSRPVPPEHKIYYQKLSNFSTVYLEAPEGNASLCDGNACCRLSYRLENNDDPATYALAAYDGVHSMYIYSMGFQVCALMRCETKGDVESCGRVPVANSSAVFTRLSLTASLENDVVFPSVVTSDLQILPGKKWNFSKNQCGGEKSRSKIAVDRVESLLIASIYARLRDRDYVDPIPISN